MASVELECKCVLLLRNRKIIRKHNKFPLRRYVTDESIARRVDKISARVWARNACCDLREHTTSDERQIAMRYVTESRANKSCLVLVLFLVRVAQQQQMRCAIRGTKCVPLSTKSISSSGRHRSCRGGSCFCVT